MVDQVRCWLAKALYASSALLACGWAAHGLGVLPAPWTTLAKPLLVAGIGSALLGEAIPLTRDLLRATRLRWSKRVLVAAVALVVVIKIAVAVDRGFVDTVGWEIPLLLLFPVGGAALLYDAWVGSRLGSLPRCGVWGAVSAGCGLILFGNPVWEGPWMAPMLAAGLAGILAGGIAGSFALRQIERAEAAALDAQLAPHADTQLAADLALIAARTRA